MATLTVYPDAGVGGTSTDGDLSKSLTSGTITQLRAGNADSVSATSTIFYMGYLRCSTTTDEFNHLKKALLTFDTSGAGAGSTVNSATLSIWPSIHNKGLGGIDIVVTEATPGDYGNIATTDWGGFGTTAFATKAENSWTGGQYGDLTLNASGIAAINTAGVSGFGIMSQWEFDENFPGTWSSGAFSYFRGLSADYTGTTNDPKLVLDYTPSVSGVSPKYPLQFGIAI